MITGVLSGVVLVLLGWGRMPTPLLVAFGILFGLLLSLLGRRHSHGNLLTLVDSTAQNSPFSAVHGPLKVCLCIIALCATLWANSMIISLVMALLSAGILLGPGKVSLGRYGRLMAVPAAFLLLGALAILLDVAKEPSGVLSIPLLGRFLVVTPETQRMTLLVTLRGLGGVSILYLLALTTPMVQLITTLETLRVPKEMVALMFLIYRYIFLLWDTLDRMTAAARCRQGRGGLSIGIRTAGVVGANLLVRSLARARRNFDAMEARCYVGQLNLSSPIPPMTLGEKTAGTLLLTGLFGLILLGKGWGWP